MIETGRSMSLVRLWWAAMVRPAPALGLSLISTALTIPLLAIFAR